MFFVLRHSICDMKISFHYLNLIEGKGKNKENSLEVRNIKGFKKKM